MENQHTKLIGHRDLYPEEVELINKIKRHGAELQELVAEVRGTPGVDLRWAAIGVTDLQTGLMALTRAVAKTTTF